MPTEDINTARGIKNAEGRYRDRVEGLTTESHIYNRAKRKQRSRVRAGSERDFEEMSSKPDTRRRVKESFLTAQALREIFEQQSLEYEEGDSELVVTNRPKKPPFPILIFLLAVLKDILDVVFSISVVFAILVLPLAIIVGGILLFWIGAKMGSGSWWKKRLIKKLWPRILLMLGIDAVPFLGIVPATTILVLMVHYEETKFVQMINFALEKLR